MFWLEQAICLAMPIRSTVALLLAISGLAPAQIALMLLNLRALIHIDNASKIAVVLFSHADICHVCAVL